MNHLYNSIIHLIAQSDGSPADATTPAPDETVVSVERAYDSLMSSLGDIWQSFFGHLPLIAAGGAVLLATVAVAYAARYVARRLLARSKMRRSLRALIDRIVVIAVWMLGLLLAAMIIFPGLTPAKALGGLGLASVAIGLAFKDIFENFFAGVLLLWRFPFEPGDYIECQDIVGEVQDTTIRMTTIRLPTDELVVVPNSFLFKNPVRVITHQDHRRISLTTGVAYGEDVARAVEVIEEAVGKCEGVIEDKPLQVFPMGFGASSVDIEVSWWSDATPLGERRARGQVVTAIKKALDDAGIEIPFPYRTLTFKEPLRIVSSEELERQEQANGRT